MENFEDLESILLQQPWISVSFAESTTLMVKAWFGDAGYALLLSDLSNMWYETADTEVIQHRSKELNKRLTAHVSSFLNHLKSLIYPLLEGEKNSSTSFSCQLNSSMLTLHVKSELSGLPFYWDFHCSTVPVEMVIQEIGGAIASSPDSADKTNSNQQENVTGYSLCLGFTALPVAGLKAMCDFPDTFDIYEMSCHLVRPLMAMSLVLQCQVRELASLLYQKDAEIEDYRESGAVLSRGEVLWDTSFLLSFLKLGPECATGPRPV
ncbi:hypothetical protein JD844_022325 [Phrynosoma platyrhinos]|uniref:Non-homologous end-joining factor 1 n=1 Tax=Phrynosoma platyrhinos TaxID=52577 RepID=A0ABQ7SV91_PHRPL|nr:hypothetical protein JD844_022325 [Phrynosoma platyrhinos]